MSKQEIRDRMAKLIEQQIGEAVEVTPIAQFGQAGFSVAGTQQQIDKAVGLLRQGFRHMATDVDAEDPDYVVALFLVA